MRTPTPGGVPRVTERPKPLIEVRNLRKWFPIRKGLFSRTTGHVQAVDDISFDIWPRETLGLVGESGCGKTTAGRALLRLIEPTSGEAIYKGQDLFRLPERELRKVRRNLQIIFQDPYSSLNPRMTVENLIGEAMQIHGMADEHDVRDRVMDLLERVGIQRSYVSRYPHEFSGGQRQRIGIARALALNPEFIVCDEAVSALDVSIQAQVINLLQDLREEFNLSYLFIAHDLGVVRHISDRVAVMYLGRMVEVAESDELFRHPAHPYTQALLSAIPEPDPFRTKERILLKGDVPTPINPPSGCRFHTRCPAAWARCRNETPDLAEVAAGHWVACHLYSDPARAGLTVAQAQKEVSRLVRAGADVQRTNTRRGSETEPAPTNPADSGQDIPASVERLVESARAAVAEPTSPGLLKRYTPAPPPAVARGTEETPDELPNDVGDAEPADAASATGADTPASAEVDHALPDDSAGDTSDPTSTDPDDASGKGP